MRKGSTPFGACEVRCWRWLFGKKISVSSLLLAVRSVTVIEAHEAPVIEAHNLFGMRPITNLTTQLGS